MSQHTDLSNGMPGPVTLSQGLFSTPALLAHPEEIVGNPSLSSDEKRALLASWVSDAHAVPNTPAWRQLDNGAFVRAEEILNALQSLDDRPSSGGGEPFGSRMQTPFRRRRRSTRWIDAAIRRKRRDDDDDDPPPTPVSSRLPPHHPCPAGNKEPALAA